MIRLFVEVMAFRHLVIHTGKELRHFTYFFIFP